MTALFPSFSTLTHRGPDEIRRAMRRAQRLLALLMLPVMIVGVSFAPIILRLWLGTAQTATSVAAMQLLLIGLVALSIGAVPFTLVQALGQPKWSAIVHVVELPIHAAVTWWAVTTFGVVGAAAAWSLRALYDAVLFDAGIGRMIGRARGTAPEAPVRITAAMTGGAVILSTLAAWVTIPPTALAVTGVVALVAFCAGAWLLGLEVAERGTVLSGLRRVRQRDRSRGSGDSGTEPVRDQAGRL